MLGQQCKGSPGQNSKSRTRNTGQFGQDSQAGAYILIKNDILFPLLSEMMCFPLSRHVMFYSYCALFAKIFPYFAFILHFYFTFSRFLPPFLPYSSFFLPFSLPFSSFLCLHKPAYHRTLQRVPGLYRPGILD